MCFNAFLGAGKNPEVLRALNHRSSRLHYSYELDLSSSYISIDFKHVYELIKWQESC